MKLNFLILLLFFQLSIFSQKDSIIIKGQVSSIESKKKVRNAYVHLVSSQGHRYEYKTDSTGYFRFHFYSESVFSCTLTIASDRWTTSDSFRNLGFLASKDQAIFNLQPGNTYEKNFELKDIPFCGPIATDILFYTNSTISCNDSLAKRDSLHLQYYDFDATVNMLYMALKEDPGIVINIVGYASSIEKNPEQLSLNRAEFIRNLMINKGINPQRIEVKGFGSRKLWPTNDMIKKAKTKKEKMSMHFRNQRVSFRIISWDYKE